MKYLLATAAICAATTAHSQVNSDCDTIAGLASAYAESRDMGIPLTDMISEAQEIEWQIQSQEDFVIQLVVSIYTSGFDPETAWAVVYGACVQAIIR